MVVPSVSKQPHPSRTSHKHASHLLCSADAFVLSDRFSVVKSDVRRDLLLLHFTKVVWGVIALSESAHVCLLESGKELSVDDDSHGLTLTEERCAVVQSKSQINDVIICFPPSTNKLVEF